jgi:hypothetical protein
VLLCWFFLGTGGFLGPYWNFINRKAKATKYNQETEKVRKKIIKIIQMLVAISLSAGKTLVLL